MLECIAERGGSTVFCILFTVNNGGADSPRKTSFILRESGSPPPTIRTCAERPQWIFNAYLTCLDPLGIINVNYLSPEIVNLGMRRVLVLSYSCEYIAGQL